MSCEPTGIILFREYFEFTRNILSKWHLAPTNGTPLHSVGSHFHIPESKPWKETALFVFGDFWLLLAGLFSVFTARPFVSVGFLPPIRGSLSYKLWFRMNMIARPSHWRLAPGPGPEPSWRLSATTEHPEWSFCWPYNPKYTYS